MTFHYIISFAPAPSLILYVLLSSKLTWQWKSTFSNREYIFKWWIFQPSYVSLLEGIYFLNLQYGPGIVIERLDVPATHGGSFCEVLELVPTFLEGHGLQAGGLRFSFCGQRPGRGVVVFWWVRAREYENTPFIWTICRYLNVRCI